MTMTSHANNASEMTIKMWTLLSDDDLNESRNHVLIWSQSKQIRQKLNSMTQMNYVFTLGQQTFKW